MNLKTSRVLLYSRFMETLILDGNIFPLNKCKSKAEASTPAIFMDLEDQVHSPGYAVNQNEPKLLPLVEQCLLKIKLWQCGR